MTMTVTVTTAAAEKTLLRKDAALAEIFTKERVTCDTPRFLFNN